MTIAALAALALTVVRAPAYDALLFAQSWTPLSRTASHESWLRCPGSSVGWLSMTDLDVPELIFVTRIVWYGTVNDPKQLAPTRRYTLNAWPDENCRPSLGPGVMGDPICTCCFTARTTRVGVDCKGKTVYRFESVGLGVAVIPGIGRVWLSIGEDDLTSARLLRPDMQWSGFETVVGCSGLQYNGSRFRSIVDPCSRRVTDLAFELYGFRID